MILGYLTQDCLRIHQILQHIQMQPSSLSFFICICTSEDFGSSSNKLLSPSFAVLEIYLSNHLSIYIRVHVMYLCSPFPPPSLSFFFGVSSFFDHTNRCILRTRCSVFQCVAICCSVTWCSCHGTEVRVACIKRTTCCSVLQSVMRPSRPTGVLQAEQVLVVAHARLHAFERWGPHRVCSILQCVAVCCGVLLCITGASQSTESIICSFQSHLPCALYTLL